MRKVAIVGAGVGGLVTAIALARRNIECAVYERHQRRPGDGAGLQLSPNATAVLHDLGVVLPDAVRPVGRELRRWRDDTVIGRTDLGGYGAPYLTVRRGSLIRALHDATGPGVVRSGRRCTAAGADGVLTFADGSTIRADAVVGADGLRSVVRAAVTPDRPEPSGWVAFRAVLPAAVARPFVVTDRVVVWLGPARHCVAYPIDGGRSVNLVVVAPAPAEPADGRPAGLTGWHPAVRGLIDAAARFDRRELVEGTGGGRWHRGRVVLIGDAAHAMLPFAAQGAAQAIEDAVTLAGCAGHADPFTTFDRVRRERVTRVVEASRAGLAGHHLPDGAEQRRRDRAIARTPPAALDWLYRHRAVAVSC
ncbi:FAD-dependent monooxygenase [Actinoplanes sp. NPDC049265]|uniref:FAD-dependent monooxygenase n=1 Tax=Actinoplanes sp. NPDC049265 TaxID=3363902 RepID=UPI003712D8BA